MKLHFEFGKVVAFDALPDNAIALDGYVQGPTLDPIRRRWSFDHHAGCLRLVTKSTCEQVREALCLGLPVDDDTSMFINDIDGDTVLSVWLLLHPERCWDEDVVDLVRQVGLTDAHGPIFKPHPLHAELNPPPYWWKDHPKFGSKWASQSEQMLWDKLHLVDAYFTGEWTTPDEQPEKPAKGYGWSARTGWRLVETTTGFDGFYRDGYVLGFLYEEAADGTMLYTVAKASDLVACPIGPGSIVRPVTDEGQFTMTVLGTLGWTEQAKNPAQVLAATWGGGTSIGGGPRNPGGVGSCLTPEEVLDVFRVFQP